jgi:hypothetical protein
MADQEPTAARATATVSATAASIPPLSQPVRLRQLKSRLPEGFDHLAAKHLDQPSPLPCRCR